MEYSYSPPPLQLIILCESFFSFSFCRGSVGRRTGRGWSGPATYILPCEDGDPGDRRRHTAHGGAANKHAVCLSTPPWFGSSPSDELAVSDVAAEANGPNSRVVGPTHCALLFRIRHVTRMRLLNQTLTIVSHAQLQVGLCLRCQAR